MRFYCSFILVEHLINETLLTCINITPLTNVSQIQVIEDGLGSLHKLAMATEEELFNCSLNTSTVNKITAVFTNH